MENQRTKTGGDPAETRRPVRLVPGLLVSAFSGLLFQLAFPPVEAADTIWIAFAPLVIVARLVAPSRAFLLGWSAGVVGWLGAIFWLTPVTIGGMTFLALYCALYTGAFAAMLAAWFRRFGAARLRSNLLLLLLAPLWWVGLEFVRYTFGTGFPWDALGVAQYRNVTLIQLASVGGVHLVSAAIMLVNVAIGVAVHGYGERAPSRLRRYAPELIAAMLVVVAAQAWGFRVLRAGYLEGGKLRAVLIQPNIPQDEKWDEAKIASIYEKLRTQTSLAQRLSGLDLIVWPETALPDDLRYSEPSYALVVSLATNGVPILVGSMDTQFDDLGRPSYFNSAMLVDGEGKLVAQYDKQHLVPFGEYTPLAGILPFLHSLSPLAVDFRGGTNTVLFRVGDKPPFAALICFEDAIEELSRAAVDAGARILINQTNDAWYDPLAGSRQHLAQAVFRCVETRVPMLRCVNTGISCGIDPAGRIMPGYEESLANRMTTGFHVQDIAAAPAALEPTVYRRGGHWIGWFSTAVALVSAVLLRFRRPVRDVAR